MHLTCAAAGPPVAATTFASRGSGGSGLLSSPGKTPPAKIVSGSFVAIACGNRLVLARTRNDVAAARRKQIANVRRLTLRHRSCDDLLERTHVHVRQLDVPGHGDGHLLNHPPHILDLQGHDHADNGHRGSNQYIQRISPPQAIPQLTL